MSYKSDERSDAGFYCFMDTRTETLTALKHEINNQLQIVLASAGILEGDTVGVKDQKRIETIQQAVAKLKLLVDELASAT